MSRGGLVAAMRRSRLVRLVMKPSPLLGAAALGLLLAPGCGELGRFDLGGPDGAARADGGAADGAQDGAREGGPTDGGGVPDMAAGPTYYQDILPIFESKCLRCHQQGGIGPFRLDLFTSARDKAALIALKTGSGEMPPYLVAHDGSCGDFQHDATLGAEQVRLIALWAEGGRLEGTRRDVTVPPLPTLTGGTDYATPAFAPVKQGGALAQFDEYRCFLLDPAISGTKYITGYDVIPGTPEIVHHVIGFVVDPAKTTGSGQTNAQVMAALDAREPDRLGWSCFGAAGDGVEVEGAPVTWAPGQGLVEYPAGVGAKIKPTHRFVIQVHYNMDQPAKEGKTDSTKVRLRYAETVERLGLFLLPDGFLESLRKGTPDSLAAGQASVKYTWTKTAAQLGLPGSFDVSVMGVMPHMHARGRKQEIRLRTGDGPDACVARVDAWNFNWQKAYFYKTAPVIKPTSAITVTCDYDTSADGAAVMPGWGTQNEMCLAVLFVALPPSLGLY